MERREDADERQANYEIQSLLPSNAAASAVSEAVNFIMTLRRAFKLRGPRGRRQHRGTGRGRPLVSQIGCMRHWED